MNTQLTRLELPADLVETKALIEWASFSVTCDAEVEAAGGAIKEIEGRIKAIKAKQEELFGPLKAAIRDFEAKVRSVTDPLKAVSAALRQRIATLWNNRQVELERQAKAKREQDLIDEKARLDAATALAAATGNGLAEVDNRTRNVERLETKPVEVSQTVKTSGYTMAQTKYWDWRVTDKSKIPLEYLEPDAPAFNKLARSYEKLQPKPEIPGIEFFQASRVQLS